MFPNAILDALQGPEAMKIIKAGIFTNLNQFLLTRVCVLFSSHKTHNTLLLDAVKTGARQNMLNVSDVYTGISFRYEKYAVLACTEK